MNKRILSIIAVIFGIGFIILAIIYFTNPAQSLPSYLPGHQAGLTKIHRTHAVASLFLGLACFAFAWFQSGKKKKSTDNNPPAQTQ